MDSKPRSNGILDPLEFFYGTRGSTLPAIQVVYSIDIPAPIQQVLVHNSDMTSKLTAFYQGEICIHALQKHYQDPYLMREVVLKREADQTPVEYGAIQIDLSNMPTAAKEKILGYRMPFGAILKQYKILYISKPTLFFRFFADSYLVELLQMKQPQWLYGRSNVLMKDNGDTLANVVEILPPIPTLSVEDE